MYRVSKGDEVKDGGLVEGLDFGPSVMLSAVLGGTAELPQSGQCCRKILLMTLVKVGLER